MDTKTILNEATGRMQKAIDHLEEELLNVRAGKASPNALNGVMVVNRSHSQGSPRRSQVFRTVLQRHKGSRHSGHYPQRLPHAHLPQKAEEKGQSVP